jgi:hypothetical protein
MKTIHVLIIVDCAAAPQSPRKSPRAAKDPSAKKLPKQLPLPFAAAHADDFTTNKPQP